MLLSLTLVITTCGGGGGGGSGSDGTPTTSGICGNGTQVDPDSISILLQQYRDEIYPTLPVDKRKEVENFASGYPVEVSGNAEPVVLQSNGTPPQLKAVINRKDWAYAEKGINYTYIGIFAVGQEKMLDVGFWCFLEAALLHPEEPEHLSNVAFYLNERGKSTDARKLLLRALSFDNKNTIVLNNLAYASAALGDYACAVTHSLAAMGQQQGVSLIAERLRYYAKEGGYDLVAKMAEAILGDLQQMPTLEDVRPKNLSDNGRAVFNQLGEEEGKKSGAQLKLEEALRPQYMAMVKLDNEILYLLSDDYGYKCVMAGAPWSSERDECMACTVKPFNQAFELSMNHFVMYKEYYILLYQGYVQIDGEHAAIGMEIIDRASLPPQDQMFLRTYWSYISLSAMKSHIMQLNDVRQKKPTPVQYFPHYSWVMECLTKPPNGGLDTLYNDARTRASECLMIFCGNISLSLGFLTVDIGGREGTVEASFGQGLQYTVGWNLKKHLPIYGIGIGVNLDKIVNLGAVLKWGPSSRLNGVVDLGAAIPMVGPILPPRLPIAKWDRFGN